MRIYETAAVKVAVKQSRIAGTLEAGREYLAGWILRNQSADIESVLKSFKKWGRKEW
jgi:hypothetical protein